MPGVDGTGPDFAGPMTGGGHGRCSGDRQLAAVGYGRGRGYARGRGRRQGLLRESWPGMGGGKVGDRPTATADPAAGSETSIQQLERQAAAIQQRLDALHARVELLNAHTTE